MAKGKTKSEKLSNPHLRARVAFLHRAAKYLASGGQQDESSTKHTHDNDGLMQLGDQHGEQLQQHPQRIKSIGIAQHLTSDARGVALKSQIRLSRDVKHSLCKVCNTSLIDGSTSTRFTQNLSKDGKKPWSDEFCVKCLVCGSVKKTNLSAPRQLGKKKRMTAAIRGDDSQLVSAAMPSREEKEVQDNTVKF